MHTAYTQYAFQACHCAGLHWWAVVIVVVLLLLPLKNANIKAGIYHKNCAHIWRSLSVSIRLKDAIDLRHCSSTSRCCLVKCFRNMFLKYISSSQFDCFAVLVTLHNNEEAAEVVYWLGAVKKLINIVLFSFKCISNYIIFFFIVSYVFMAYIILFYS